jgi:hypothetical protein
VSRWLRVPGFSLAVGTAILVLYLVHPILGGHRLPIGPDGPVYVWWTRYADAEGLGVVPGRFGVPSVALMLGTMLRTEPLQTVAFLGPILAAATGLAAAAAVEMLLGPNPVRSGAAAVLSAAWAGHLAAGYLGTLATATLFLCAIGAFGLAERSWRAVLLGGGLMATAALSHRPLLVLPLAILAGAMIALAPGTFRRRREGASLLDTLVGRVAAGTIPGAAAGIGLDLIVGPDPTRRLVETSQDAFLRAHGLGDLLRRQFRTRLAADAQRSAIPLTAGAALGVAGIARRAWERASESRFLLSVLGSWAALSLAGVAALLAAGGPANRLVTFAFFVPLLAAVGFEALIHRRGAGAVLAASAALTMVVASMYGWYRQEPFIERTEVETVKAATGTIDALPRGTPLVFLVDTDMRAAAFHVTRFANVIRTAVPSDRIADVRLAVGRPEDYLSGRPTITGNREHDRLSTVYLAESRIPGIASAVFVVEPFNRSGFSAAARSGTSVAPSVVALRGGSPIPSRSGTGSVARADGKDPPGLGPIALTGMSIGALGLLALVGTGWARWGLPGAPPQAVMAAAPSVGLATLILGAAIAQVVGISPSGAGGVGTAVLGGGVGYVAAARRAGRHSGH